VKRQTLVLLLGLLIGTCAHARDVNGNPVDRGALPTMTLLPAVQDVPFLEEVVLELWMDFTAEPTRGGGTDIHYDPDALDYVSFEFDANLGDDPELRRPPDTQTPGVLDGLAFGSVTGLTGPALVGRLVFQARLDPGPTALTMTADEPDGPVGPFVSAITLLPMEVSFIGAEVNLVQLPSSDIEVDPRRVTFDRVRIGQEETRLVSVSNRGDGPLRIDQVGAFNPVSPPFGIVEDRCSLRVLPPGGECKLLLAIRPQTAQNFEESFAIPSSDPVTPIVTVGLFGMGTLPLGIDAVAFDEGLAVCRNFATAQTVVGHTNDAGAFNCEANGLTASENTPVSVSYRGRQSVAAGVARGMAVSNLRCENLTSGQIVDIALGPNERTWSCLEHGLVITPGDDILMTAVGTAD
jgi:hypothetical protein